MASSMVRDHLREPRNDFVQIRHPHRQRRHHYDHIAQRAKDRFPELWMPTRSDLCYATTNRQNAVAEVAPEVDLVLVIGSRNSSNSQRLVETANQAGKAAYLIDDQTELDPEWFEGVETVLITAGASAPEHLVQDLVNRLQREYLADSEVRTVAEEDVSFAPPKSLRTLTVVG